MLDLKSFNVTDLIALAQTPEAKDLILKGLASLGVLSALPKFVAWATPYATIAADKVADVMLKLPVFGSLLLLFAPDIVKALQALNAAIDKFLDTFTERLEADLAAAAAKQAALDHPAPPAPAPAPAPGPAAPPAAPGGPA